jgi:hypothetical protein
MKKIQALATLSAIALMAAGFAACSSSDETVVDNPRYNPETNEVTTNFVFNVSTGNTAFTRQSAAATQATVTERFRGIDNAVLYSYHQGTDGKNLAALPADGKMEKRYDLSMILAANTVDADHSHRIIETSLPLNTNTLLFYGKAILGNAETGLTVENTYGHLEEYNPGTETDLSAANFELSPRIKGDNVNKFKKIEELLSGILTTIMYTNLKGTHHQDISYEITGLDGTKTTITVLASEYPELIWADYNSTNSPVEPTHVPYALEQKLADVYREMTTIYQDQGELRAGSGQAILAMMTDLWSVINEVRCATPLNKPEAVAKYFAERAHERIKLYFNGTVPDDGHNVTGVEFVTTGNVIDHFTAETNWPTGTTKPSGFNNISDIANFANFPQMFHLPSGSTHLAFDKNTQVFSYPWNYNTSGMPGSGTITVESYFYPAELLYFGNSAIRVSDKEYKPTEYPDGVANWDEDNNWNNTWTKNSHVQSTTQSVAMQNDINYGTAALQTTIRYGVATLKDNNHAIQKRNHPSIGDDEEPDQEITVDGTSFQLVGVIVGGQSKKVGWNFLPKESDNSYGWINDDAIPSAAQGIPAYSSVISDAKSQPNYTLVFDNYTSGSTQDKVYVALELRNNTGKDFYGLHNLIRNGSTFYLIGELDPAQLNEANIDWPTHHALPPYDSNGATIQTKRVFIQDFMTTADFVIGANSLKYAYLTVPDLRYSSVTLGLSVDIKWSTGINFDNVILGGN